MYTSRSMAGRALVLCLFALVTLARAATEGKLQCYMIPIDQCAFAVDSNGARCVLEHFLREQAYACQTSDVLAGDESLAGYVETDECIAACGVERMTVGFSTDAFATHGFTSRLCSSKCREECPNLVDLFSNIVVEEGITLSELCSEHKRSLLLSEHEAALAPASPPSLSPAATPED